MGEGVLALKNEQGMGTPIWSQSRGAQWCLAAAPPTQGHSLAPEQPDALAPIRTCSQCTTLRAGPFLSPQDWQDLSRLV